MGWSTNQKAQAKRQKEKEEKQKQHQIEHEKKQSAKWKDQQTDKKFEQKKKKQQEKQREHLKKLQMKQLLQKQQQEMDKISKKKPLFQTKKLTQAQILISQQRKINGLDDVSSSSSDSEEEKNPNRVKHDFEVAENVEQALNMLNFKDDKHPEKRFKAAFLEYCDKRQVDLKLQNPHMKRTQRMELMRKEFEKHPDNPFNKVHKEFNEK